MSDVQQARIEAAAKAMWEAGDPREPGWPDLPHGVRQGYRREARAALAAGDAVVTVEMIAEEVKGHQLGEDWGDDGIGHVGCGDCGEWFGKALEGGWDRAFLHIAVAIQRLYRGEGQS